MKVFILVITMTFSASVFADEAQCKSRIIDSAQRIMTPSDEITDIQSIGADKFVVTYYMYDTCYGSIYVAVNPTKANDCEVVSVEEDYYPRCH